MKGFVLRFTPESARERLDACLPASEHAQAVREAKIVLTALRQSESDAKHPYLSVCFSTFDVNSALCWHFCVCGIVCVHRIIVILSPLPMETLRLRAALGTGL